MGTRMQDDRTDDELLPLSDPLGAETSQAVFSRLRLQSSHDGLSEEPMKLIGRKESDRRVKEDND